VKPEGSLILFTAQCSDLQYASFILWGVVSPHPTSKLQDHFLLAVRDCLFSILVLTLHMWTLVFVVVVFFFFSFLGWGKSPLGTSGTIWPIVPAPDDKWWVWSSRWNENWQGKPKYSEKTCPRATLSTTNPTWPDLGLNPGRRRGEKPVTNRPSYGTAHVDVISAFCSLRWRHAVGSKGSI
jgi:hypothetical protein